MPFSLVTPAGETEALAALGGAEGGSVAVLAGGTDLLLDIDEGRRSPSLVVSLRRLPWRSLVWDGPTLTIGSTLPLSDVEDDPRVRERLPGLWEAVHAVGGRALRHRATLGGNLGRAAPSSDLLPILLALDAEVEIVSRSGVRGVKLSEFLLGSRRPALGPGELIRSLTIPETAPCAYAWQRVRPSNDISQVGIGAARSPSSGTWRLAIGGVPPTCRRLLRAEKELEKGAPGPSQLETAADVASKEAGFLTDKRATEEYRRHLVRVLVRRAVRETTRRTSTDGGM